MRHKWRHRNNGRHDNDKRKEEGVCRLVAETVFGAEEQERKGRVPGRILPRDGDRQEKRDTPAFPREKPWRTPTGSRLTPSRTAAEAAHSLGATCRKRPTRPFAQDRQGDSGNVAHHSKGQGRCKSQIYAKLTSVQVRKCASIQHSAQVPIGCLGAIAPDTDFANLARENRPCADAADTAVCPPPSLPVGSISPYCRVKVQIYEPPPFLEAVPASLLPEIVRRHTSPPAMLSVTELPLRDPLTERVSPLGQ